MNHLSNLARSLTRLVSSKPETQSNELPLSTQCCLDFHTMLASPTLIVHSLDSSHLNRVVVIYLNYLHSLGYLSLFYHAPKKKN